VNSFGIGESFNEEIMQAISDSGKGQYFFIRPGTKIKQVVSDCMEGVIAMAAVKVSLDINEETTKKSGIKKIFGLEAFLRPNGTDLAVMRVNEQMQVLVLMDNKCESENIDFVLKFQPLKKFPEKTVDGEAIVNTNPTKGEENKKEATTTSAPATSSGKSGFLSRLIGGGSYVTLSNFDIKSLNTFSITVPLSIQKAQVDSQVDVFYAFQLSSAIDQEIVHLMNQTDVESLNKIVLKKKESLELLANVQEQDKSGKALDALVKGISVFQSLLQKQTEVLGQGLDSKLTQLLDDEFGVPESTSYSSDWYSYQQQQAPQEISYAKEKKNTTFSSVLSTKVESKVLLVKKKTVWT